MDNSEDNYSDEFKSIPDQEANDSQMDNANPNPPNMFNSNKVGFFK